MGFTNEFREFALKGNVVDMAVGIVIGSAFSTVVSSLVDHVLMPPIGMLTSGVDFSELAFELKPEEVAVVDGTPVVVREAVTLGFGAFINSVISFAIVALALFLVICAMNRLRHQSESEEATPAPTSKKCPECLMEIPLAATRCGHCTSHIVAS